jgi:hypothetical protein
MGAEGRAGHDVDRGNQGAVIAAIRERGERESAETIEAETKGEKQ